MRWLTVAVLGVGIAIALVAGIAMIITRRARYLGGQEITGRQAVIAGVIVFAGAAWMGWIIWIALRAAR